MGTPAFEDFKLNDYYLYLLFKAQVCTKYVPLAPPRAPLSQYETVNNKTESLGNSLVWIGFYRVGATGFEPAT